jgi:hypothetical protein
VRPNLISVIAQPRALRSKAPEGWRTPRRFAFAGAAPNFRQVLDCGSPLPLFPSIVHPKMKTGKECSSAECARLRSRLHCVTTRRVASTRHGVRPNLISVIAQPRAPRPVK